MKHFDRLKKQASFYEWCIKKARKARDAIGQLHFC